MLEMVEKIADKFSYHPLGGLNFAENVNKQKRRFLKVLRMERAIAENDRTTRETLLQNWRASQRPYGNKIKKLGAVDRNRGRRHGRSPLLLQKSPPHHVRGWRLRLASDSNVDTLLLI